MMTTCSEVRKHVPKPRRPRPRPLLSHRLHFPPLGEHPGQLTSWRGKEATDFEIRNLGSQFGVAYTLTKLVPDEDAEPVVYQLCIEAENPQDIRTHCSCPGHERYGYCRHTRVIVRLLERGELRTHHQPEPTPATPDRYADCPF